MTLRLLYFIRMRKFLVLITLIFGLLALSASSALAQRAPTPAPAPAATEEATATPSPRQPDLTSPEDQQVSELRVILEQQEPGSVFLNPFKHAIRNAAAAGVSVNTIVLLLLLPLVAAIIGASRHIVGLRGFGIALPAALSVVFLALGPIVGIGLFLIIVFVSTAARGVLRRLKIKMQYLPRMALILLLVSLGVLSVLFAAPFIPRPGLINISIFPVLLLILFAEDFTRAHIGKSVSTAVSLTSETLILALVSYAFLTLKQVQIFALLNPELFLILVALFDFVVGQYIGLRFLEFWRFRRLITK